MNAVASELASIGFFLVLGWVALWPSRNRVGAAIYHLAAIPVGLLAAPLSGCVSTVTGRPLDGVSAAAGGLILIIALWTVQRIVLNRDAPGESPVGPRSFVATAGAMGLLGAVVGLARYTVTNNDSIMSYWPLGIALSREGVYTSRVAATRSALIPSMNAIHAAFGSDWAYVIYPILGATLALWLATSLWMGPLRGATRRTKMLVAGGAAVFMILEPAFMFHSFFVHSHMLSALYLLMSLTCMWLAVRPDAAKSEGDGDIEVAYLVIAGVCAAGLALTRPDGLAYQFVPVVAAISVLTTTKVRWRSVAAFFAPTLFLIVAVYGAMYLGLGMWQDAKLSGFASLAIIGVLALSATGPWIVESLDRLVPWRVSGERFLAIVVSVATLLMLGVFILKWGKAAPALAHARINLFQGAGGYHYLWYAVVLVLALSIVTGDAPRTGSWTRSSFLSAALFCVIAGLIHGTSHPGRIGPGDSLNRVMFHVVPLLVWYAGAVVTRILGQPKGRPYMPPPTLE